MAIYHFKRGYNRTQIAEVLGVARGSVNTQKTRLWTSMIKNMETTTPIVKARL
ncbi:hypothetical protein ACRRS0_22185 [Agarivorans sp. QJM3NY_29]|uniref:hypothetical protein n=1 Tax=unclassified Agarivorans TaxID=2636026 RepID=UPI003D7CD24F